MLPHICFFCQPSLQTNESTESVFAKSRVTGGIYRRVSPDEWRTEAERAITVVLSETPYKAPRPYGPLHVCGDLSFDGEVRARWGAVTAVGGATGGS